MERFNWLQISFAERYVISLSGDFELVRRMLAKGDNYRHGRRIQIA